MVSCKRRSTGPPRTVRGLGGPRSCSRRSASRTRLQPCSCWQGGGCVLRGGCAPAAARRVETLPPRPPVIYAQRHFFTVEGQVRVVIARAQGRRAHRRAHCGAVGSHGSIRAVLHVRKPVFHRGTEVRLVSGAGAHEVGQADSGCARERYALPRAQCLSRERSHAVLLGGVILHKRKYTPIKYLAVLLVTAGILSAHARNAAKARRLCQLRPTAL